jgi:hypothetical protein
MYRQVLYTWHIHFSISSFPSSNDDSKTHQGFNINFSFLIK